MAFASCTPFVRHIFGALWRSKFSDTLQRHNRQMTAPSGFVLVLCPPRIPTTPTTAASIHAPDGARFSGSGSPVCDRFRTRGRRGLLTEQARPAPRLAGVVGLTADGAATYRRRLCVGTQGRDTASLGKNTS